MNVVLLKTGGQEMGWPLELKHAELLVELVSLGTSGKSSMLRRWNSKEGMTQFKRPKGFRLREMNNVIEKKSGMEGVYADGVVE